MADNLLIKKLKSDVNNLLDMYKDICSDSMANAKEYTTLKADKDKRNEEYKRVLIDKKVSFFERGNLRKNYISDELENKIYINRKTDKVIKLATKIIIRDIEECTDNLLKAVLKEYEYTYGNKKTPWHYVIVNKRLKKIVNDDNIIIDCKCDKYPTFTLYIKELSIRTHYQYHAATLTLYYGDRIGENPKFNFNDIPILKSKGEAVTRAKKAIELKKDVENLEKKYNVKLSQMKAKFYSLTYTQLDL